MDTLERGPGRAGSSEETQRAAGILRAIESEEDDALAARSRDGDPLALAVLYRRHAPALLRHVGRQLRCRAEAEDILQETFVRVFEGRGRYEGRGHFRSWLFTIATRLVVDRRRAWQRRETLLRAHYPHGEEPSVDAREPTLGERTCGRIAEALAALPADYALALRLRITEGFTYAEIAAICGDSEGTLRSRVYHALRRLRAALAPDRPPEARIATPTDALATRIAPPSPGEEP